MRLLPKPLFTVAPEDEPGSTPEPPEDKPISERALEEQVQAYKQLARRREEQLSKFGGVTPDDVTKMSEELDRIRAAALTEQERAIEEAKAQVRQELETKLALERVNNALEKHLSGRVPDTGALLSLDRSQFITGDSADVEKIKAWVEQHSTEVTKSFDLGQGKGRGSTGPVRGLDVGRELFNRKGKPNA